MVWPRRAGALLTFIILFSFDALSSARAEDWPVPRGPSHEPFPYRYEASAWTKVPRAFLEETPACTLYSGTSQLVEADGTIETITHEITRFNGRKGIDKLGEYRNISYDPSFQTLTLNEARVLKADGQVMPIARRHVQLRDLSTDYQVYDHEKQLIISFPDLEVGDAIEVKWTVRGKNVEHEGQFFTRYNFGDDTYPVVRDELRVRLPRERALKYAATGGRLDPQVRDDGAFRLYLWQVDNRPQLPQDDNLPSKEDLRLQVACSTFASWEEVGAWKQKIRSTCWDCTRDIKKTVEEVTRGLKTPEEKARALTYWVRRNIRYVSVGEHHDYTPHPPATVFGSRYGDCKDTSQLLAVMLHEAGIPAALVTLGVQDDGQVLEEVPSPWGTHAILLVTLDGKEHWIDTTISLASWDFLPHDCRDRLCYMLDAEGRSGGKPRLRLLRTPPMTPEENRIEQTTHLTIGCDGSSRSQRTLAYHGNAALVQREAWSEVPPGERRRLMAAELQDANSRTRLSRLVVDDRQLLDFDRPVSAALTFDISGHFSGDGDREGSISESKLWGKLLSYNLDYDRTVPLYLWAPFELWHHYVIELPPGYRLDSVPQERVAASPWGSFTLTVKANSEGGRKIELDFHTRLEKARVEPADFEAFRKFHEEVGKYYRVWLTLKPVPDLQDACVLEGVLALAPDDSAAATTLARLYAQKPKEARRVLERARYYNPSDITLAELALKSAGTPEEEEAAYRDLIRRFPDQAKYALALGAALVNRGAYTQACAVLEPVAQKGSAAGRGLAHYQLARCSLRQNEPAQALEHLEAADMADPAAGGTVASWQLKGRAYEKLGRTKEAALAYHEVLKTEPDDEEALASAIRLALAAGERGQALDLLRRYTVVIGDDVAGLAQAAEFHLRLERYEDAFDLASRARDQRFHEKAQRVLGIVYLHRGDHAKAVLHLDRAEPDATVLEASIRARLALGDLRGAEAQAAQAAKLEAPPEELRKRCAMVQALVQRQAAVLRSARIVADRQDAWDLASQRFVCAEQAYNAGVPAERIESLLDTCFTAQVELGPAYALRGWLEFEHGRLTKALADAERAICLSPDEALGHCVRGCVRLERGGEGALDDLYRAAELSQRKEAVVLHWLADALRRAGRAPEALATQREAVKLKPWDKELVEQLREFEKISKTER